MLKQRLVEWLFPKELQELAQKTVRERDEAKERGGDMIEYYCLECEERFTVPNGHWEPITCPKGHTDVGLVDGFVASLLEKIASVEAHRDEIGEALMGRDI